MLKFQSFLSKQAKLEIVEIVEILSLISPDVWRIQCYDILYYQILTSTSSIDNNLKLNRVCQMQKGTRT